MKRANKQLIQAANEIKTPLAFLSLIIIISEGILLYLISKADGTDLTILVIMIAVIPVASLIVFYLLYKNIPNTYQTVSQGAEDMAKFASKSLGEKRARLRNQNENITMLKGRWDSKWYLEGEDNPYVNDNIYIEEIDGNEIFGKGEDLKGVYEFEGLYLRGVLSLVYKYRNYPMAGVIVLKVGLRNKTAKGKWYGYLVEDEINGGKVEWEKIS